MAESGVPGYELSAWFGLLAPAGTPDDIVKTLNVTIAAALKEPEVNNKLAAMGAQPVDNTPKQFAARIKAEVARWIDVVGKNEITQR